MIGGRGLEWVLLFVHLVVSVAWSGFVRLISCPASGLCTYLVDVPSTAALVCRYDAGPTFTRKDWPSVASIMIDWCSSLGPSMGGKRRFAAPSKRSLCSDRWNSWRTCLLSVRAAVNNDELVRRTGTYVEPRNWKRRRSLGCEHAIFAVRRRTSVNGFVAVVVRGDGTVRGRGNCSCFRSINSSFTFEAGGIVNTSIERLDDRPRWREPRSAHLRTRPRAGTPTS